MRGESEGMGGGEEEEGHATGKRGIRRHGEEEGHATGKRGSREEVIREGRRDMPQVRGEVEKS